MGIDPASVGLDSGPLDSGPLDSGPLDSGPLDSGPLDSGPQWSPPSTVRTALPLPRRDGAWPAPPGHEHTINVLGRPLDRGRPGPRSWPDEDARAEQLPRLLPDGLRF